MANRKQFLGDFKPDSELLDLLRKATKVTEEQLRAQRVSFAFGNSPESTYITKASVERSSKTLRLVD